jgi:hypothetical protein
MARISLIQPINLNVVKVEAGPDGKDKRHVATIVLGKGINEVDPEVLTHPYIRAHMKAGSVTIVPDPLDPEDIAAAAEEIARRTRAEAEAAKALKAAKQKEIDDALAAASKPVELTAEERHRADEEELHRLIEAEEAAKAALAAASKPAA